jgi:hypothetical protein
MNGQQLREQRENEYKVLNSFTSNYRMPVSCLGEYADCLDRIRALNKQLEGVND